MARWRPPRPKSSPYITPAGERALQSELRELWRKRRTEVVPAEGDRSENAEYIYRKRQLAEIDRRVNYLSRRLDAVEVVRQAPPARDRVYFSAHVTLSDTEGETRTYRIVGADETDAPLGYISVDSPLARALLGKRQGDSVAVSLPDGSAEYCIESIDYEN